MSNLKKSIFLAIGEGSRFFGRRFSTDQRQPLPLSDAWPAHATYHRARCEHCDTLYYRVGRSFCSDFMTESLVLSIDVCRGFSQKIVSSGLQSLAEQGGSHILRGEQLKSAEAVP